MSISLASFSKGDFDPGRSKFVIGLWALVRSAIFLSSIPWPSNLKVRILRAFGASIGTGVVIKQRIYIHFPWRLKIGDDCWLGERCELLNLCQITLGSNSALAHDVYLAAGGHDTTSRSMVYKNAPIVIGEGAWLATRSFVGPGVEIGDRVVVAAGAVVVKSVPSDLIVGGVPAKPMSRRDIDRP